MPMSQTTIRIDPTAEQGEPRPIPLALPTSSTTDVDVEEDVRRTIRAVSLTSLAEDLLIAVEVRRRDARDLGREKRPTAKRSDASGGEIPSRGRRPGRRNGQPPG